MNRFRKTWCHTFGLCNNENAKQHFVIVILHYQTFNGYEHNKITQKPVA